MNYDNTFINSDIKILNEESFYKEDKVYFKCPTLN